MGTRPVRTAWRHWRRVLGLLLAGLALAFPAEADDPVEDALRQLASGDARTRETASLRLGRLADLRASVPLQDRLASDPSPEMRAAAALALGFIGDPASLVSLSTALASDDPVVAPAAAEALRRLSDPSTVGVLGDAVGGPATVPAARALEALGDPRGREPLRGYLRYVVEDSLNIGRRAGPPPHGPRHHRSDEAQEAVVDALGGLGDREAIPLLRALLSGREQRMARVVADEVEADAPWFHREDRVLVAAARALARLGDPAGTRALLEGLDGRNAWLRAESARSLGAVGDATTTSALVETLARPLGPYTTEVHRAAAEALGEAGDERAVPALLHALATEPEVAVVATRALGRIAQRRASALAAETPPEPPPPAPVERGIVDRLSDIHPGEEPRD
ncbi:MAG: HEAT repeat domain-containing protein [Planctomycetes bacterium]|nr:HEAT repeat domain-containing protein [Planctomycetota bacterium]